MNTLEDKAYKLASSFYLSSPHDDWSGARIRRAILADPDSGDKEAIADQQELVVWDPIERHICANCSMDDPNEELDDLIENLADGFLHFAKEMQSTTLEALKACKESIRHAAHCKAPQAYPCSCDADHLWKTATQAIKKAEG